MDDQGFSGPAHAATMVIAGQDFLAQAAEAGSVMELETLPVIGFLREC